MRLFRPLLALAVVGIVGPLVGGCSANASLLDDDSGLPVDSSIPKDSASGDSSKPGTDSSIQDSSSNDANMTDADMTDADDGAVDDGAVEAGVDAGKGCKGVLCTIGHKCCNNIASVHYGHCCTLLCAGVCL